MTTIESAAFAASASILKVLRLMKLRPVLLVLVLLSGFYYVTTRGAATGNAVGWLRGPLYTAASEQQAK